MTKVGNKMEDVLFCRLKLSYLYGEIDLFVHVNSK